MHAEPARDTTSSPASDPHAEDPREVHAAHVALHGTRAERLGIAVKSLHGLLTNPNETQHVLNLGLVVNHGTFPQFLTRLLLDPEGARLFRDRPTIDRTHVDFDHLRTLPETTLGGAYVRFLDRNGLDPDLFQPPPGLPEVPRFVAQRMRQTHDLWHVLTGYATDVPGEIALQAFTYSQTRLNGSNLLVVLGCAKWGTRHPGLVRMAREGYQRGTKARFLPPLRFEEWFERDLEAVRRELNVEPLRHAIAGVPMN